MVQATEVRERAERRLGDLMAPMPKAEGTLKVGPRGIEKPAEGPPTLGSLGIDQNLANRARKKAKLTDEAFEAHVKKATSRAAKATARTVTRRRSKTSRRRDVYRNPPRKRRSEP